MIYVFYVPGMPFDGHTILRGESLGGSETAGLSMAAEMARRGHRAIVFANIPREREGKYDGVQYCGRSVGVVGQPRMELLDETRT